MSMKIIFRLPPRSVSDVKTSVTEELRLNLQALLTDKDISIIEFGDVSYELGTEAGRLEPDVKVEGLAAVYVTFYTGRSAFTVRTSDWYELTFQVQGRKLIIENFAFCD